MTREDYLLAIAEEWIGYYRENIHRFAHDYLHVNLRTFQEINLFEMDDNTNFIYIASRGQGKTFLIAVYCCCRAILYPGEKIVIASGRRGQAMEVLEKIMTDLRPFSPELSSEIDDKETKLNGTTAIIKFKNGSYCKVVTAAESARGNRANILIMDEFRLIDKDVIDTILKHFLASEREPPYEDLTQAERDAEKRRKKPKERNRTLWSSSAYVQDSWAYDKCLDTFDRMVRKGKKSFICGLPYQLAIKENLLREEDVFDRMDEADFSEVKFSMEMGAIFWGSGDGAFFDYDSVSKNRRIKYPMLPDRIASKLSDPSRVRIPMKQNGEVRILSADIALMSSKKNKNDATAIFINCLMPTKAGRYTSNIVYTDSYEGLRTDTQALIIRKMFDEYNCDYIVLDCQGIGLGTYDCLANDIVDPDTGEVYPALSCCNNQEMADRCTVPGANKVIWSIKASAQSNSDMAFMLREGFRSGRIRLLINEYEADKIFEDIRGFKSLTPQERTNFRLPYIYTTLLIDELVKLQHEEVGGRVKISEQSGQRKDRYSSLAYNFYVAIQLENKLSRKRNNQTSSEMFIIRPPSNYTGRVVSRSGERYAQSWQYQ